MKTLKAIAILEYFGAEQMINNNTPFEEEDYVNAIDELEELQNRSCENCKHQNEGSIRFFCSKTNISFDIGGCGDYWESK